MALPRFEKQYQAMLTADREVFAKLRLAGANPKSSEFRDCQRQALRVIHINENALCSKTESTHFSNFSSGLADKFWALVRANYPEIDYCTE
jgi:hypothetical protein